jgi:hypothetical protein
MPNFGTYYIDAATFNDATTITDAAGATALMVYINSMVFTEH